MKRKLKTIGYLYILESDGKTKIGITKNSPSKRVAQLQTGSPNPIRLVKSYRTWKYKQLEQDLHKQFSLLQTNGGSEWFAISPNLVIAFIEGRMFMGRIVAFIWFVFNAVIIVGSISIIAYAYLASNGYI